LASPSAFDATIRGSPVGMLPLRLSIKTRMVWLPDGDKNFEDIFVRCDGVHERDIGRAYA